MLRKAVAVFLSPRPSWTPRRPRGRFVRSPSKRCSTLRTAEVIRAAQRAVSGVKVEMKDGLRMLRSDDRNWMLGLVLCACLSVSADAQPLATGPEELAGPWEVTGPSSVDGIFVMISRSSARSETIQVRVYRRRAGYESGGWYVVRPAKSTPTASFDGRNLRVLELTATFDPIAAHWTGDWVFDGQTRKVVLERPRPAEGSTPNLLCGDWERVPDPQPQPYPATSVRLHIRQLPDGGLIAWMDTVSTIIPQRVVSQTFGRSVKVVSPDPRDVVLQNESPTYNVRYRFRGVLSDDGNSLAGTWNDRAPESFRRIR